MLTVLFQFNRFAIVYYIELFLVSNIYTSPRLFYELYNVIDPNMVAHVLSSPTDLNIIVFRTTFGLFIPAF